jgi:lipopolysaccharide transport system ATP-binding protein
MSNLALKVENVSKIYRLYNKPVERLKESIHPYGKKYHQEYFALRDVTFELKRGETLGIIGKNGSGKSTLLKIITGVLTPSTGTVTVNGKIAALLELGAGFNMEFTGIENIYMSGTIMGYTKAEMDAKLDEIIAFADIGDYIYQPVKMYSSGMFARLAFSVNSHVNPDILIVDEALSVGDMFFQAKCLDRMKRMMDDGMTIIFVSHDTAAVKSLCQRGILLEQGNLLMDSTADDVVEEYFNRRIQSQQKVVKSSIEKVELSKQLPSDMNCFGDNSTFLKRAEYQRIQNGKVEFYNIQLLDDAGHEVVEVDYGQTVTLRMAIVAHEDIKELGHGYHIRSTTGVDVVYSDSILENKMFSFVKKGDRYIVDWQFKACLMQGTYNLACGMSIPLDLTISKVDFCDFVPCAVQFFVKTPPGEQLYGYVHWGNKINVTKV